eukprot:764478-Hanusia_phi.AAC.3
MRGEREREREPREERRGREQRKKRIEKRDLVVNQKQVKRGRRQGMNGQREEEKRVPKESEAWREVK